MSLFQAIILGIIEGITEFLPISSTGHMILASSLMQMQENEFTKTFEISIQLGAILAVVVIYYKRFLTSHIIYTKLLIAFIPTGILGLFFYKSIKLYLFNPVIVSIVLIIGGVVLILLDNWSAREQNLYSKTEDISYSGAIKIGFFQCLSMIPGVSRAAATIFGGVFSGFNRSQAAEFSFLLAVPTMFAATAYDLLKTGSALTENQYSLLLTGGAVAFIFAIVAIKTFIAFINKYGFKHFGYYRIILGILFLILFLNNKINF